MKKIEYCILEMKNQEVTFYISEQTCRMGDFGHNSHRFVDSKGFILMSQGRPENSSACDKVVFVRGLDKRRDEDKITMSLGKFLSFANAVKEYNEQTLKHGEDEYNED